MKKLFDVDFTDKDILLTRQKTLRKLVGILGILLPILLCLSLYMDSGFTSVLDSISHYYFTRVGSIFVIIVSLLAIFLIIYKGPHKFDYILSSIAGYGALVLLLFPTGNIVVEDSAYSVTTLPESGLRKTIHYASAGIFLLSLAAMSIFLFTKSNVPVAKQTQIKRNSNRLYRICGILMILAILFILLCDFFELIDPVIYNSNNLTFWMEVIAIEAFGIAWLVKGKTSDA